MIRDRGQRPGRQEVAVWGDKRLGRLGRPGRAGCPPIRFHDLRHTYASLLIEQGENIKYIQSQLGHSSPTVTLNVYATL